MRSVASFLAILLVYVLLIGMLFIVAILIAAPETIWPNPSIP